MHIGPIQKKGLMFVDIVVADHKLLFGKGMSRKQELQIHLNVKIVYINIYWIGLLTEFGISQAFAFLG